MPWIAEELAKSERCYQTAIDEIDTVAKELKEHPTRDYMKMFADNMADAGLFWMSRTAVAIATDLAGNSMPETTFQELINTSDLPPVGMLLWPKPIATFQWRNMEMQRAGKPSIPVTWDGIAWIYDQTHITSYLLSQMTGPRKAGLLNTMRPDSCPGKVVRFDKHDLNRVIERVSGVLDLAVSPLDDPAITESTPPTLTATVISLLALIGQQRVVSQKRVTTGQGKKSERTARPEVTMLDIVRPPGMPAPTGSEDSRELAFRRWYVRGHVKHQPYGPGNSLRKLIYVSLHTAGHPDAPDPTGPPPPRVGTVYGKKFKRR